MMKAPWQDRAIQAALARVACPLAPPADRSAALLIERLWVKAPCHGPLVMVRRERGEAMAVFDLDGVEAGAWHHEDPGITAGASARARGRQPTGWP